MSKKPSSALTALTISAMAIPGVGVQADTPPEEGLFSYRYTNYQESDVPIERVFSGSTERYNIQVHQFSLLTPIKEKYSLRTDVAYESLSGASPRRSEETENGDTRVYMSGASIEEQRLDVLIAPKRYFDNGNVGAMASVSDENDYQSTAFGLDGNLEIFDKHTTLSGSLSWSRDTLNPTDKEDTPEREAADGETKDSFSFYEGVTQILDKHSVLQLGVGYTRHSGYLSDPYKELDVRPEERDQYTLNTSYRDYMQWFGGGAFHLDYRYYEDSWKVRAHTITTSWWQQVQVLGQNITWSPSFRYYMQNSAYFYNLEQNPASEFYSGDARLSAFGAMTFGLDAKWHTQSATYSIGFAQYFSSEDWVLFNADDTETPGLVDFTTFSLGIDYPFSF